MLEEGESGESYETVRDGRPGGVGEVKGLPAVDGEEGVYEAFRGEETCGEGCLEEVGGKLRVRYGEGGFGEVG